jgi:ribonucleoside-diphosphate reductase beta chain
LRDSAGLTPDFAGWLPPRPSRPEQWESYKPGANTVKAHQMIRYRCADFSAWPLQFAEDLLGPGVAGLSLAEMHTYLQHVVDWRLAQLGIEALYGSANPLAFMALQDVQELSNFFERRVLAYRVGVTGEVSFDDDF